MNFGKTILELRKKKNVTQEELAAELGVTAAAVSKWENGYTLPDILMLCALADYFAVTTDALLGRNAPKKQAIVVTETKELGQKIAALAQKYNIQTSMILTDYDAALAAAEYDATHNHEIKYMFTALSYPLEERESGTTHGIIHVNVHVTGGTDEDALNGIELYLKNADAFQNISDITATGKRS